MLGGVVDGDARRAKQTLERERGGRAGRRVQWLVGKHPEDVGFARERIDEIEANRFVDRRARETARVPHEHKRDSARVDQAP